MDYNILGVFVDDTGALTIWFSAETPPTSLKSPPSAPALTLNVDNSQSDLRQFALADATLTNSDTRLVWNNTGLSWSVGDTVRLWLTVNISDIDPPLPTLTASASPDPVAEGGQATITLTLSAPVDEETSIQRRLGGTASHDRASDADYHYVDLPTFADGSATATTTIRTIDDNRVENCETVTWAITMWPGTYRAVHASFTMAINDNDGGNACVGGG